MLDLLIRSEPNPIDGSVNSFTMKPPLIMEMQTEMTENAEVGLDDRIFVITIPHIHFNITKLCYAFLNNKSLLLVSKGKVANHVLSEFSRMAKHADHFRTPKITLNYKVESINKPELTSIKLESGWSSYETADPKDFELILVD